jgi:hypothetical protein
VNRRILVLALLVAGCKNEGISDGGGGGVGNPQGTVAGIVLEAGSEAPLAGVTVKIVTGASTQQATTDASGVYRVGHVPSGPFVAQLDAADHVPVFLTGNLMGAVGMTPVSDPQITLAPIGMLASTGKFRLRLIDDRGSPAPKIAISARTRIRWVDYSMAGGPVAQGSYAVTGTSGDDGIVELDGLPDYSSLYGIGYAPYPYNSTLLDYLSVDVPPVQVMGSDAYSFLGGTFGFYVNHLSNSSGYPYPPGTDVPTVVLAGPLTSLQVIDSNIEYLRGITGGAAQAPYYAISGSVVPPTGEVITIAFNEAVDKNGLRAQLTRADGSISPIQPTVKIDTNLLTLETTDPLDAGQRYNLVLYVTAALDPSRNPYPNYPYYYPYPNRIIRATAPFFVAPTPGSSPSVPQDQVHVNTDMSGKRTLDFYFSEAVGVGAASTEGLSCIAFYENDFDGDPGSVFQGEWVSDPTRLVCPANPAPVWDVTRILPLEVGLITGFTSHWQIKLDGNPNDACKKGTSCSYPPSGTKVHLVFTKTDANHTVHRADGEPLDFFDGAQPITFTIP